MAKNKNQSKAEEKDFKESAEQVKEQSESNEEVIKDVSETQSKHVKEVKVDNLPKFSVIYGILLKADEYSNILKEIESNNYKDVVTIKDSNKVYVGINIISDVNYVGEVEIPLESITAMEAMIESLVRNATSLKDSESIKSALYIIGV